MGFEDRYREEGIGSADWTVRTTLSVVLIAAGVIVAFWAFMQVYKIFTHPEELTVFQELVSDEITMRLSADNNEFRVLIPPEFIAYVIPIMLLAIAVSIAGLFIRGGVNLLAGDARKLTLKFAGLESAVQKHMAGLKDRLDQIREPH